MQDLSKRDDLLHKEEQILLRVPHDLSVTLEMWLNDHTRSQEDKFRVEIFADGTGVLHVGKDVYRAKLANLPTIVESHRTYDGALFYKSADINQVLIVEGGEKADVELYKADVKSLHDAAAGSAASASAVASSSAAAAALATGDLPFALMVTEFPDGPALLDHGLTIAARNIRPARFNRPVEPPQPVLREALDRLALIDPHGQTVRPQSCLLEVEI